MRTSRDTRGRRDGVGHAVLTTRGRGAPHGLGHCSMSRPDRSGAQPAGARAARRHGLRRGCGQVVARAHVRRGFRGDPYLSVVGCSGRGAFRFEVDLAGAGQEGAVEDVGGDLGFGVGEGEDDLALADQVRRDEAGAAAGGDDDPSRMTVCRSAISMPCSAACCRARGLGSGARTRQRALTRRRAAPGGSARGRGRARVRPFRRCAGRSCARSPGPRRRAPRARGPGTPRA